MKKFIILLFATVFSLGLAFSQENSTTPNTGMRPASIENSAELPSLIATDVFGNILQGSDLQEDAKALTILQSFSTATPFPPTGWQQVPATFPYAYNGWLHSTNNPNNYSNLGIGDGNFAYFNAFNTNISTPISLISPAIAVGADKVLTFQVMEVLLNVNYIDDGMQLYVDFSTDGMTFTESTNNILLQIPTHNQAVTQAIKRIIIDLAAYSGQTIYVRFRAISDYGGFILFLDNIGLQDAGTDLKIEMQPYYNSTSIGFNSLPKKMPLAHASSPVPIRVTNSGTTEPVTGYTFSTSVPSYFGPYTSGAQATTLSLDASMNHTFTNLFTAPATGTYTTTGSVSLAADIDPSNNTASREIEVTEHLFQVDDGEAMVYYGSGNAITLGTPYRFRTADHIRYVQAKFSNTVLGEMSFKIYSVNTNANPNTATEIYSQTFTKPTDNQWMTLELPYVEVQAGTYLFAFDQPSTYNMGLGCIPTLDAKLYGLSSGNMVAFNNAYIPAIRVITADPPVTPSAPTAFTATPDAGGLLSCALAWNNPTTTLNGSALTDISSIIVKRDGNTIATYTTILTPGAACLYTDNTVPGAGSYTYTIYATNSAGDGEVATQTVFVGSDPCAVTSFPWTENFSSTGATFPGTTYYIPTACWATYASPATSVWKRISGNGTSPTCTPHSSGGMIQYNCYSYSSGHSGILVSPPIATNNAVYKFSFWMYRDNSYVTAGYALEGVNIYAYSSAPTSSTVTGTPLLFIPRGTSFAPAVSSNGWYQYEVYLPALPSVYVVIQGVSRYGNNIYVDDLALELAVPEFASSTPMNGSTAVLVNSAVTATTNFENLTAGNLSSVSISPDPGGVVATFIGTQLTIAHNDFDFLTTYTVTIPAGTIAEITNDYSWSFTTERDCNNYTLPLTMGFEVDQADDFNFCWTQLNQTSGSPGILSGTTYAHSGTYSYRFVYTGTSATLNQYLFTPPLPVTVGGKKVSFFYRIYNIGYIESFRVGYSTTNNELSSFTWDPMTVCSNLTYLQYVGYYPGDAKYIAIHYASDAKYFLYIDDILIEESCPAISNLQSEIIGENSVKLTWTAPAVAPDLGYRISQNGVVLTTTQNTTIQFDNLDPDLYSFTVEALYNESCIPTPVSTEVIEIGTCQNFVINLHDSYGDGWNGNFIEVRWDNLLKYTLTIAAGYNASYSLTIPDGKEVSFTFVVPTTYTYPTEVSFEAYDGLGNLLFSRAAGSLSATTALFTYTYYCPRELVTSISYAHDYDNVYIANINPADTTALAVGAIFTKTITVNVAEGFHLEELLVNGTDVIGSVVAGTAVGGFIPYTYTFVPEPMNYEVEAVVKVDDHTLNYIIGSGIGTFNGDFVDASLAPITGSYTINYDLTLTYEPAQGYEITSVSFDGSALPTTDYSFTYGAIVYEDHNFEVNFDKKTITATTEIVGDGTVTPMTDSWTYDEDRTYTFDVQANGEYHISSISVNGVRLSILPGLTDYTYTVEGPITDDLLIKVVFGNTRIIYTTHVGIGVVDFEDIDATLAPVTTVSWVPAGDDYLSLWSPITGYHVSNIIIDGIEMGSIAQYNFTNVENDHFVDIWFVKDIYTITTAAYANGTISDGVTFEYDPTYEYNYVVTPGLGQSISSLTVNGEEIDIVNREVAYNGVIAAPIITNYDIVAHFASSVYTVTATAGNGGFIAPYGATTYNWHATPAYTITANEGYYISALLIDGVAITVPAQATAYTYDFAALVANHTIEVQFTLFTYGITAAVSGTGGTITPAGLTTVNHFANVPYIITPNTGYDVQKVEVDGLNAGAITTYTFINVAANHTITAFFTAHIYTITAFAGVGGTITPSADFAFGANATYTITPLTGYHIEEVLVDGVAQTITNPAVAFAYTFSAIAADHNITATFALNTYTITVTQPTNGTITPGTAVVNYGASKSYTIAPAVGYHITAVTVNGIGVTFTPAANGSVVYNFTNVTENKTLTATMAINVYTFVASASTGGTIAPAGTTTGNYGTSKTYTISPNAGYVINNVEVDGFNIGAVTSYIFTNINANHTIAATFKLAPCVVPGNLYVTDITMTSATLHWNNTGASGYKVRYKAENAAQFTESAQLATNSYALTGLTKDTRYIWEVKAICVGQESAWSPYLDFTTLTEPYVSSIDANSANSVNVYSNTNIVYVENEMNVRIDQIDIYDIYGKVVYSGTISSTREAISLQVADGIYVVRLMTENGVSTTKVNIIN